MTASCHVVVSSLVFPPYDGAAHGRSSAIGTIQIDCPPDVEPSNPRISLSPGGSGRFAERQMTSGKESLRYNLYLGPSHLRVIGDGSGGSEAMTAASAHSPSRAVFTIYGRILAGQAVSPGQYSDDLTIQMEF
ncbi:MULTISPECIES: Csu type fimbrial protein [Sphingobium]|nr:spore coat U domain-containing protein [Sphingobium sp. TKS]KMS59039.1 spore coat protein [Sphingobium baderi LL03]